MVILVMEGLGLVSHFRMRINGWKERMMLIHVILYVT